MMYLRMFLILLSGAWLGWVARHVSDRELEIRHHWAKIEEYFEYINDPRNSFTQNGITMVKPPSDVRAHTDALVGLGELKRGEIVIPGLPNDREHVRLWLNFASDPEIIDASSSVEYQKGQVPLMFTVWYLPEAAEKVQKFKEDLLKMAKED